MIPSARETDAVAKMSGRNMAQVEPSKRSRSSRARTTATNCPRRRSRAKTGVTSFSIAGGPVTYAPLNPWATSASRSGKVYSDASTKEKGVVTLV